MTKQILYLLTSIVLMGAMCIDAFFETNYFGELLSFCIIMYICWFLIESIGGFTIVCLLDSLRYKARKVFNKDVKIIDISDDDKKRRESLLECLNKMCACAKIKDHYNYKRYGIQFDKLYFSFDDMDYAKQVRNEWSEKNVIKRAQFSRYAFLLGIRITPKTIDLKPHSNEFVKFVESLYEKTYLAAKDDNVVVFREAYLDLNYNLPYIYKKTENDIYAIYKEWIANNAEKSEIINEYFITHF